MTYQKRDFQQQSTQLPEIDHKMAVWIAFNNVLNSFQMADMVSMAEQGSMVSVSEVKMNRFRYTLGLLDGLIDEDKDLDFRKEGVENVLELMRKNAADFEWFGYWSRVDKLLRRGLLYTANKGPSGHL